MNTVLVTVILILIAAGVLLRVAIVAAFLYKAMKQVQFQRRDYIDA